MPEVIITLESDDHIYQYDDLGITQESSDAEVVGAVSSRIFDIVGIDLLSQYQQGNWLVKRSSTSGNTYILPKSTAG